MHDLLELEHRGRPLDPERAPGELAAGDQLGADVGDREGDLDALRDAPYMQAMADETGSVLMGRRTFDMAGDPDEYADSYELQAPIFVVTHTPPERHPEENDRLTFTFVTDGVASAAAQAREAAQQLRGSELPETVGEGTDLPAAPDAETTPPQPQ